MTKDQIRAAAMNLEPAERELLADELLQSTTPDDEPLDPSWLKEIERREADLASGKTKSVDAYEVIDRLLSRKRL